MRCSKYADIAELFRIPKLSGLPEAVPNVVVCLNVVPHKNWNQSTDILVMIDHGDMLLRIKFFQDCTVLSCFIAFVSRWITTLDAPHFVLIDRGSNYNTELMWNKLDKVQVQLCSIPPELSWGIGLNRRSLRYLHKRIAMLLLQTDYATGYFYKVILVDMKVWMELCSAFEHYRLLLHQVWCSASHCRWPWKVLFYFGAYCTYAP